MALVKHITAKDLTRDAVVLDLGDLQRQGAVVIEQARIKADAILSAARAERDQILAGAQDEGRSRGLAEGLEEGRRKGAEEAKAQSLDERRAELDNLSQQWGAALAGFAARRDELVHAAERDVVRLAITIADKVVKRRLNASPELVVDQVRSVLSSIMQPTGVAIRIHPEDRPLVVDALGALLAQMPVVQHAECVDDTSLPRGSCVAEMRGAEGARIGVSGRIEADINQQLDRIAQALVPDAQRGTLSY